MQIELGISTFGETTPLEKTGQAISHDERIRSSVISAEYFFVSRWILSDIRSFISPEKK